MSVVGGKREGEGGGGWEGVKRYRNLCAKAGGLGFGRRVR